jgi:uncharacterized tellurite resistance protein B-like protein
VLLKFRKNYCSFCFFTLSEILYKIGADRVLIQWGRAVEENIIKKICTELEISHKELADLIGVHEQTLRNAASTKKFSNQIMRSLDLLVENHKLRLELNKYIQLKDLLKDILK